MVATCIVLPLISFLTCFLSPAVCRDAQDAARGRDGYDFFGNRLRVEMSRGARDRGPPPAPPTFRGRGTGFRVLIKGLPISASWQDLKVTLSRHSSSHVTSASGSQAQHFSIKYIIAGLLSVIHKVQQQ